MRRGRVRALMVPVVLAALLAGAACAPTTDPATLAGIDPAAQSALDSIRELPFDESRVHALSRVLTAAGVEVVEGPDPGDSAVSVTGSAWNNFAWQRPQPAAGPSLSAGTRFSALQAGQATILTFGSVIGLPPRLQNSCRHRKLPQAHSTEQPGIRTTIDLPQVIAIF